MKRSIVSLALLVSIISSYAQTSSKFGIKAGINNSGVSSNMQNNAMLSSRTSWYGGVSYTASVSKVFNLQTELLYSKEGCKSADAAVNLDYLRLPILFQYQHPGGLHAEAGLQPGFLLKANQKNTIDQKEENYFDKIPHAGLSMIVGAGYRLKNGLGVEARYAGGLNSVFGTLGFKLAVVSAGLSYNF